MRASSSKTRRSSICRRLRARSSKARASAPIRSSGSLGRGGMGEVWLARRSDGRFEARVCDQIPRWRRLAGKARRTLSTRRAACWRVLPTRTSRGCSMLARRTTASSSWPSNTSMANGSTATATRTDLDVEARIRLFVDAVLAVAHAHSNLIVHRDLKPSNVLVTRGWRGQAARLRHREADRRRAAGWRRIDAHTSLRRSCSRRSMQRPSSCSASCRPPQLMCISSACCLYVLLIGRHPLQSVGNARRPHQSGTLQAACRARPIWRRARLRKKLRGDLDAILATALHHRSTSAISDRRSAAG